MRQFIEKHLVLVVCGIIGGVCLLFGLIFGGIGFSSRRAASQLEDIPVLDLASLGQTAAGVEVALEGKISERNPFEFRPFVAYISHRYDGERCTNEPGDDDDTTTCESIWTETERVTPPLWLDLSAGRVRLANTDYQVHYPPFTQQSPPELIVNETKSYQGFRIGDPVFAIGQVVSEAEEPSLKARIVAGGNQQSYLANTRSEANIFIWIGGFSTLVGGFMLALPFILKVPGTGMRR